MKLDRTKNSLKGIFSGFINKIVTLILPFIVRTIFIYTLGIEYLGLNSLFISLLNILNLAELGIGSAIAFSLYGAIANDDEKMICATMNFYKKIYRIIGFVVMLIGIILLPFIPYLCKGQIPADINIYIIYVMHLSNSVLTYFLYSYKTCLLVAHQQTHVMNNVNTVVYIALNVCQIAILLLGLNYYIYLSLMIISTMANNIINAVIVSKRFPKYKAQGEIDKDTKDNIIKKVKALFFYKIGAIVLISVDSIVISSFLGLTVLGKYNNYYYVITTLFGFIQVYTNAMLAGVGNSIINDSLEKNINDFKRLNFLQGCVVGWSTVCLLCLYQPFISLWLGESNMFTWHIVIFLSLYFYVWKMMDIVNLYKEAAGLWEYDKYRPLVASIVNLLSNIILVNFIGIYGIIISTIISIVFIIFPWSTYVLYKQYFKTGYLEYLKKYAYNFLITLIAAFITYCVCLKFAWIYTLKNFIIRCVICVIVPNVIFLVAYCKTNDFKSTVSWILKKFKIKVS